MGYSNEFMGLANTHWVIAEEVTICPCLSQLSVMKVEDDTAGNLTKCHEFSVLTGDKNHTALFSHNRMTKPTFRYYMS